MDKFDYKKAEADLEDMGIGYADEVYSYKSEKSFRSFMKEHDLNPDKYYKPDGKGGSNRSGSGSGTEGCYLTSACVNAKGLPDDCEELQILRAFRDDYLALQPDGKNEIGQYYEMAPRIVASINRQPEAVSIWSRVFEELVSPCVKMIREGQSETAHRLYKAYSLKLYEQFC